MQETHDAGRIPPACSAISIARIRQQIRDRGLQ
jgi:hypothetical protein